MILAILMQLEQSATLDKDSPAEIVALTTFRAAIGPLCASG
jgi:hypothetical protein